MSARRPLALAATGLILTLLLAACGSSGSSMPGMDMSPGETMTSTEPAASADASRAGDIAFAQLMIPHHEQAVQMADIALEKQTSAEVKTLAEQIKAAQDPEIAEMKSWLQAWGAPEQMPSASDGSMGGMDMGGMDSSGMMSDADMTKLMDAAGQDFDRMWLQMMIAHHQGAIAMADQVLSTTADPKVTALAKAIVAGQTAEIATMQGLLAG